MSWEQGEGSDSVDTQYTWGAAMNVTDLPEALRSICEGRTVVQLNPVADSENGELTGSDDASCDNSNQMVDADDIHTAPTPIPFSPPNK